MLNGISSAFAKVFSVFLPIGIVARTISSGIFLISSSFLFKLPKVVTTPAAAAIPPPIMESTAGLLVALEKISNGFSKVVAATPAI